MYKGNKKRLTQVLSAVMATALVLTSVPGQAKTSKKSVTQIQVTSPYSAKDKKVTTTLTLKKGSTFKIKTSVSPTSASKKLVYKSSKKKVATVSKSGKIKARKVGKANITIQPKTNKNVKAVIKVTVVKKLTKVKKIKLDQSSLSLSVNGSNRTAQLKASIVSPKKPTNKKFNWFTSNKDIATVNNKGVVTAKKAGSATITVTAADGRGAKAVCKVSVTEGSTVTSPSSSAGVSTSDNPNTSQAPGTSNAPNVSGDPNASSDPGTSNDPNTSQKPDTSNAPNASNAPSPSASAAPAAELTIVEKSKRTGIKQGETIQLTADGPGADKVTWTADEVAGVTMSTTGLLVVADDAKTTQKIKVTATTSADVTVKTATAEFSIVENKAKPLTDSQILLNVDSEDQPLGLTYRSATAYSKVTDPERGEVVRFDAADGWTPNANDMLAWMVVDEKYAGKTVTISGYMKYEAEAEDLTDGKMNLIINENWGHNNPAKKYNADPGKWEYISGTFTLPSQVKNYDGNKNRIYIARSADHLKDGKNAVYYIQDLKITIEESVVESVAVSAEKDATTIYQNHELQFSATVTGKNNPSSLVNYSIEPEVPGAEIDDTGLLKVGNVPGDTEITVKAVSVEDPEKSDTKTITVLEQTLESVSVTAAGKVTRIYSGDRLQFSAKVVATGDLETKVTWSLDQEVTGADISADGFLTTKDLEEGTEITVVAVATAISDPTKTARSTYTITVLGDYVEAHEVKAIKSNQWDAFTDDYASNLQYDEEEESVYYENGTSNLATGSKKACIGFLINSDGSAFDASAYNILRIKLKADAAEDASAKGVNLRVYSDSDTGYSTDVKSLSEPGSNYRTYGQEREWIVPLTDLTDKEVSLVDMKALSLETSLSSTKALKVYSFTFERISPYQPYSAAISQKDLISKVGEDRELPLEVTVNNFYGDEVENVNINWESSDTNIATVSENGVVTGVSAGEVEITATVAGYDDAKAKYTLTVYDHSPVSLGIHIGEFIETSSSESIYMTEDELSPSNGGIEIKAVWLDAGREPVGEVDPDEIKTMFPSTGLTPTVTNNKLAVTLPEDTDEGNITVQVKVGESTQSKKIEIYKGYRIPITKDTVYNASSGKENNEIEVNGTFATINGSDEGCNGIGFKYTLADGQKLSQYSKVKLVFEKAHGWDAEHNWGEHPVSLYAPVNEWNTGFITCGTDTSKLASQNSGKLVTYRKDIDFTLSLSEEEKDTNIIHMAAGFGDNCAESDMTLSGIILLK